MTIATPSIQPATLLGKALSLAFLCSLIVAMAAAGWISLYEGTHRFMQPLVDTAAATRAAEAAAALNAEPTTANMRRVSEEMWALSQLTSVERFAESGLIEHGLYYLAMPRTNQILLMLHVLLSVFCVTFGGLQFWPGFRKRYMKAHRVIGMTYVATVPIATLLALIYLGLTPPDRIYAHLIAWIALWIFGALAIVSVVMAMLALKARRLFEHQAWMALSFGCLLIAPLLRLDWVALALIFPGIDQETLNLVTMGLMLPECLLIAYALILINRRNPRPMTQRKAASLALAGTRLFLRYRPVLLAVALVFAGINVLFYLIGDGMAGIDTAVTLMPTAMITHEQDVFSTHPALLAWFVLSISLAFPTAVDALSRLLKAAPGTTTAEAGLATPLLALGAGISACLLGWHIGLAPAGAWLSGGTMYLVNGLVIAGFSLMLLSARRTGDSARAKESLIFLLCLLPFPSLFVITLQILGWIQLLPADYIAAGQGYVIPVGFSGGLLFLALIAVVHGQATREHN